MLQVASVCSLNSFHTSLCCANFFAVTKKQMFRCILHIKPMEKGILYWIFFILGMCHFLNPSLFEIQEYLMFTNGSSMPGKEQLKNWKEKGGNTGYRPCWKIPTSDMALKQQHKKVEMATNNKKMGWNCNSNGEKHKYNSKYQKRHGLLLNTQNDRFWNSDRGHTWPHWEGLNTVSIWQKQNKEKNITSLLFCFWSCVCSLNNWLCKLSFL